ETLFPGRIDLGIGRAPGSDPLTARALSHGPGALGLEHFPNQIADLIAFRGDGVPAGHPFAGVRAMPTGPTAPDVCLLGPRRRTIAGAPAQAKERLLALADEYGVDELVVVTITHSPKARLRSYELLAEAFGLERGGGEQS